MREWLRYISNYSFMFCFVDNIDVSWGFTTNTKAAAAVSGVLIRPG